MTKNQNVDPTSMGDNKFLKYVLNTLLTIAVGLSGFAMNQGYETKMQVVGMQSKIEIIEKKLEKTEDLPTQIAVLTDQLDHLKVDLQEIKADLKILLKEKSK